ncbi:MAG: 50S ribosomal protein L11 methyltransferase [Bdellovibrionales bacterium]|jgi:ribosomal protein L11 methyltransferase
MITDPDLYTLTLTCRPDQIEAVEALFEDDALAISILSPPRCAAAQVEALLDGEPAPAWVEERLHGMDNAPSYTIAPVGNLDWLKKVAQDFPPLPIARWTVYGAAHRDKITDFSAALQIDATSAFGTGEHPTTRGCLEALDRLLKDSTIPQPHSMLDMGCGSGILAMAFAKTVDSGIALGVDMDELSVTIANENAAINGVAERTTFIVGMGYAPPLVAQGAPYDLIMANIFADPLCAMAGDLKNHLKVGGHAILSGLLNTQADAVIAAHLAQGLTLTDHQKLGEWSVLVLTSLS